MNKDNYLQVLQNEGLGNCVILSIQQMVNRNDSMQLRKEVVTYALQTFRNEVYANNEDLLKGQNQEDWDQIYLNEATKNGFPLGKAEIKAACLLFKSNCVIINQFTAFLQTPIFEINGIFQFHTKWKWNCFLATVGKKGHVEYLLNQNRRLEIKPEHNYTVTRNGDTMVLTIKDNCKRKLNFEMDDEEPVTKRRSINTKTRPENKMTEDFKIRCALLGHSMDVRGVVSGETEGGKSFIVSGSRDRTSKIWMPDEGSHGFNPFQSCEGHTNFVSCVAYIPPNPKYPQGLILTGGHDHTVLGFEFGKHTPIFRLLGHKGTVCSIAVTSDFQIVTGSCDQTGKVWIDQQNVATLTGHEAAIWAVASLPGSGHKIITGSADLAIRLWVDYKPTKVFKGHTDCVRTLAVVDSEQFLSGSNDATIRLWNISSGETINIFYGHTNFIYSLALFPNGTDFASVGEDRTLRIWKKSECCQVIHLPATSVWSVATMSNGDVITGSSDGTVRVFTSNPERMADPVLIAEFEKEVSQSTTPEVFFPVSLFLRFAQAPNYEALKGKLGEFLISFGDGPSVVEEKIDALMNIGKVPIWSSKVELLIQNCLSWPVDKVFPVLDLLRLGILTPKFATDMNKVISICKIFPDKFMSQENGTNQMLCLRILCNAFGTLTGDIMANTSAIVCHILNNVSKAKNNQIASATVILNFSIVVSGDDPKVASLETQTEILMATISLLEVIQESEAIFRVLVSVGNLITKSKTMAELFKSLNGDLIADKYKSHSVPKIQQCASQILKSL